MKKCLFYIFILALLPIFAMAQQQPKLTYSIEIDEQSFAPVQTGPLSGVMIDKIEPDYSQRPCARIKMHINRMSREDINGISVKVIGGNVVVMKRLVAAEGNGLIIELTAKPETRFYLRHPKYGDSNDVSLSLEGNKEYRINAQLNYLHTIVVSSNIVGADVYLDDEFTGRTGDDFTLTVDKVLPGPHKIRVESENMKSEKEVEVSSSQIFFRVDVVRQSTKAPSVTISVYPRNATVSIGGTILPVNSDGVVKPLLLSGSYQYVVSAKDYHEERGTIVVRNDDVDKSIRLRPAFGFLTIPASGNLADAKVYIDDKFIGTTPISEYQLASNTYGVRIVKDKYKTLEGQVVISDELTTEYTPTLAANFATVTLRAAEGCGIYVNGEYKGTSSWSGDLLSGSYTLEARKEHHRTTTMKIYVVPTPNEQAYTLETPQPILGTIYITSTPGVAQVYIDKELVGETPLRHQLIIGKHEIVVRKEGFADSSEAVDIVEGKDMELNVTMSKGSKITYTASVRVHPRRKAFDAKIISHTFKRGVGVIEFDQKLREVGREAFYNCRYLESIIIPDGVTSIGNDAFYRCTSLRSITIPNSVTDIGNYAFSDCTSLPVINGIRYADSYLVKVVDKTQSAYSIQPGTRFIKGGAFSNCSSLTSITIPDSVISIGWGAFNGCTSLTSVTIPNSVTSIGNYAFKDCKSLTSITIPNSVTSIGSSAFEDCKSLPVIDGIRYADTYLVKAVNSRSWYTIKESTRFIGNGAFYGCESLTSVTIPDSVISIGWGAFNGCTSLTSVTIPNSVTSIGDSAFFCCYSLTSVTIPDSVTSIGSYAFQGCKSLTSVYITNLSAWCKIDFSSGEANPLNTGANLYLNGSRLTEITIPWDITEIKDYAFNGCTSLTSITIPDSVTSIRWWAFRNCTSLRSVYCKPTTPPSGIRSDYWNAFSFNATGRKIYIPRGSVSAYRRAKGWNSYRHAIVGYDF